MFWLKGLKRKVLSKVLEVDGGTILKWILNFRDVERTDLTEDKDKGQWQAVLNVAD